MSTELGPDALDFWIGEWTVSWPGGTGTNQIVGSSTTR